MFDRLLDIAGEFVERFYFFQMLQPFERGVKLRLGEFHSELDPGLHWLLPIVDQVIVDNVVVRTVNLQAQSLTTKDDKSVVVGAVVTCSIRNIKKALLEVEGVDDAIRDSCLGEIADMVCRTDWDDLNRAEFVEQLTQRCRERATEYGITVKRVRLSDVAKMRALRIHMDQTNTFKE